MGVTIAVLLTHIQISSYIHINLNVLPQSGFNPGAVSLPQNQCRAHSTSLCTHTATGQPKMFGSGGVVLVVVLVPMCRTISSFIYCHSYLWILMWLTITLFLCVLPLLTIFTFVGIQSAHTSDEAVFPLGCGISSPPEVMELFWDHMLLFTNFKDVSCW